MTALPADPDPLAADTAPSATGGVRPRVAVTWADSAPSHKPWFHEELAGLTASAAAALTAAGAHAVVLDAATGALPEAGDFDGVLVMGGGDVDPALYGGDPGHPAIDAVDRPADDAETRLVLGALAAQRPVLGICRGLQLINVALGGTLHEDLPASSMAPGAPDLHANRDNPTGPMVIHDVAIHSGTRLARMLGSSARVVSGHHQAAARLGTGLRAAATAADGVVEAIEATDPAVWLVAVQWHPEDPQTRGAAPGQLEAIMGAFAAACREQAAVRAAGAPEQEAIR